MLEEAVSLPCGNYLRVTGVRLGLALLRALSYTVLMYRSSSLVKRTLEQGRHLPASPD